MREISIQHNPVSNTCRPRYLPIQFGSIFEVYDTALHMMATFFGNLDHRTGND